MSGRKLLVALSFVSSVGLLAGAQPLAAQAERSVPRLTDPRDARITIVEATFVTELDGGTRRFQAKSPDKYRGLVLTLRIEKPAGSELRLSAPDLALHYRYGEASDVVPCNGLSTFSASQAEDRAMRLFPIGYGASKTQRHSTNADVVYVDAFFQGLEPHTRELHLLLAQPIGASFSTRGYGRNTVAVRAAGSQTE